MFSIGTRLASRIAKSLSRYFGDKDGSCEELAFSISLVLRRSNRCTSSEAAMNIQKILFPTDFSRYNDAALEYAKTLAAEADALLYIVHVDEMQDFHAAMGESGCLIAAAVAHEGRPEVRRRLEGVLPATEEVIYEHYYLRGSPVHEIVQFAERENVDLIVMGSHGRNGLSRLIMGSVAEGVMRKAPCPVLIVKQPAPRYARANNIALTFAEN
jgi:nucleotide-binding universal stress UspA family protein